ncbi:MAG: hypothetical protein AAGA54_35300 [Myxococcota bacterium]
MKHYDLPVFIAEVRSLYPAQGRTARSLLLLISATRGAIHRARPLVRAHADASVKAQLLDTLEGLDDRLDEHIQTLASLSPGDPMPESLAPLLESLSPYRFFTPEFATPLVVEEALDLQDDPDHDTAFLDELRDTMGLDDGDDIDGDQPDDDRELNDGDHDDHDSKTALWGAAGVLALLGGGLYAATR